MTVFFRGRHAVAIARLESAITVFFAPGRVFAIDLAGGVAPSIFYGGASAIQSAFFRTTTIIIRGGDTLAIPERTMTIFLAHIRGQAHFGICIATFPFDGSTSAFSAAVERGYAVLVVDSNTFAILVAAVSKVLAIIWAVSTVLVAQRHTVPIFGSTTTVSTALYGQPTVTIIRS
jgi:hypothetical protein